jgi:DNA-binding NarL/FixJ family response regulator
MNFGTKTGGWSIQKKYPRLARKVVFLSGVSFTEQAIQNMTNMGTVFLPKPIKPETLVGTLQTVAGESGDVESRPDSPSSDG